MIKLFAQVINNKKRHNWLKKDMTEAEFTVRFIVPLIEPHIDTMQNLIFV